MAKIMVQKHFKLYFPGPVSEKTSYYYTNDIIKETKAKVELGDLPKWYIDNLK